MGYFCEWATGQSVYLDNMASQTRVTITSSSIGQQQQASSTVETGRWTAPPEVLRSTNGIVVKLLTAQGERFIHIQGNHVSPVSAAPLADVGQPLPVQPVAETPAAHEPAAAMPPLAPMTPLPPLRMGTMQMDQTAMTMQMGGMRLEMPIARSSTPPSGTAEASEAVSQPNFCSQCGSALKPTDRFCASCGQRLS